MNSVKKFKPVKNQGTAVTTPEKQEFSERLGMAMTQAKRSIADLARGIGVSYEMARRYLGGTGKPSHERGAQIAAWLGCDFDWLWHGPEAREVLATEYIIKGNLPLYTTADKDLTTPSGSIAPRDEAKLAMKVAGSMGAEISVEGMHLFKTGDIIFITEMMPEPGRFVLLEAKKQSAFSRYLIRRVEFDGEMEPVFAAMQPGYPKLSASGYEIIGCITALLSDI